MKILLKSIAFALFASLCLPASASDWQPPGPIKLMIAFAQGGGADSQARLIAEDLEKSTGWKFLPENVTGKGGVNLLNTLKGQANDGTVIGMVVTESLAYNRIAAQGANLELADFTALTTTAGFQMGVVSKAGTGFDSFEDVLAAARDGKQIRFGAMSPRLADLAYLLGKAQGIDFNIVMLKGGKAVMNSLNAGDIDVGWGAGIQTKAVKAGEMFNLVSGLKTPLDATPDAPLIADLGVEYDAGGYFMFVAPGGMSDEARNALAGALSGAVSTSGTKSNALIEKAFGGVSVISGAELDALLEADSAAAAELMKASAE